MQRLLAYEEIKASCKHYPFASCADALFHMAASKLAQDAGRNSDRSNDLYTDLFTYVASELRESHGRGRCKASS